MTSCCSAWGMMGIRRRFFPGQPAVDEKERRVVANFVPKFKTWRLTMTYPVHQSSPPGLLSGRTRTKIPELIEKVIGGDMEYPAARVQPVSGTVTWILGEMA